MHVSIHDISWTSQNPPSNACIPFGNNAMLSNANLLEGEAEVAQNHIVTARSQLEHLYRSNGLVILDEKHDASFKVVVHDTGNRHCECIAVFRKEDDVLLDCAETTCVETSHPAFGILDFDKTPSATMMSLLGNTPWVRLDDDGSSCDFEQMLLSQLETGRGEQKEKVLCQAAIAVVRNSTHWCLVIVDFSWNKKSRETTTTTTAAAEEQVLECQLTVVGSTEHAKNRPLQEILSEWESVFAAPLVKTTRAYLGTSSVPIEVVISYSQRLQYGNMGCMFAAHSNFNLFQAGGLDLPKMRVQPGDRVVEQRGWLVTLYALESDQVEMLEVESKTDERLLEAQQNAAVEVLSITPKEVLTCYTARSMRVSLEEECLLRVKLYRAVMSAHRETVSKS